MKVSPERSWSKLTSGKYEIWTVDGPILQQILFVSGVEDGEKIFPTNAQSPKNLPEFKKGMTELEITELYRDTLTQLGGTQFELQEIGPKTIAGKQGFRFEFTYAMKEGLKKSGVAEAVLENDKLYLVVYSGAQLHYYPKNLPDAEQVMNSIEIL